MIYEFSAKIINISDPETANVEVLKTRADEVNKKLRNSMIVKGLVPEEGFTGSILVKSQASISSMPSLTNAELEKAIDSFKLSLEEFAAALGGEVSKTEGFYNSERTFNRLF